MASILLHSSPISSVFNAGNLKRSCVKDVPSANISNSFIPPYKSSFLGAEKNLRLKLILNNSFHSKLNSKTNGFFTIKCAAVEDIEEEKEMIEMDAMERMEKTLENVKNNFNSVRTGRATTSILDRVEVEYYGVNVVLKSIAQISVPDGSTLLIAPFDKTSLPSIEKSILKSDLNLNPNNDGSVIRISIPQLTEERRKELTKTVSKLAEDGKVSVRNVRRDAIKSYEKLEKEKKISEDNLKDLSADIQKMTDDYVKKIDAILKQKEKDLLSV